MMKKIFITILTSFVTLLYIINNSKLFAINNSKFKVNNNKIINCLNYIDESVSDVSSENYDISIVTKFNYRDNYSQNLVMSDVSQLLSYRKNAKNYYLEQNTNIVNQLNLSNYSYDISYFSPYIEIIFDDIEDYENNKDELMNSLNRSNDVESVIISYLEYDEAIINDDSSSIDYPLSKAFEDIGVLTSSYTGNGIRIGTIESGTPNSTSNLKTDKFTRLSSTTTSHSTLVTSIIGGNSGIAEDAHLYCIGLSDYSFTASINRLIDDYEVNIINMSNGRNQNGTYDNYCAYIDYIIATTGCTFVKSAGNNGTLTSSFISSPGCGMNIITVGSISANLNVSYFSSWNTINNYVLKPDMVAPGEKISNIPHISGSKSGTSFATPMVVGIVALLMEEFPSLKINPNLVKATLHNGCIKLPSQYSYFDEQCGFGLVNYENSRNSLNNSQYNNFNITTNSSNGDIISSYNVNIPATTKIDINSDWTINSAEVNTGDNSYIPNYTECYLKLYDIQNKTYIKASSTNSNISFLSFTNSSSYDKQYRIDVVIKGDKATGGIEVGSFVYNLTIHNHNFNYSYSMFNYTKHKSYCKCGEYIFEQHVFGDENCTKCGVEPHTHIYSDWTYYNHSSHIEMCTCGATGTETSVHVIRTSDIVNQKANCLECGHLLDLRFDMAMPYSNLNIKFSLNGSYILPNGIIVLIDK